MEHSREINELASALAKAQAEFTTLKKGNVVTVRTKMGGTYTYAYADLADVLSMCLPKLTKHGLALVQPLNREGNVIKVVTRLIHTSGQWIEDVFSLPVDETDKMNQAQAIGSICSYTRRYALTSFLSICSDEDRDANDAPHEIARKAPQKPVEAPKPEPPAPTLTTDELVVKMSSAESLYHLKRRWEKYGPDYGKLDPENQLKVRMAKDRRKTELNDAAKAAKQEKEVVQDATPAQP